MREQLILTITAFLAAGFLFDWPVERRAQAQAAKGVITPAEARVIAKEAYIYETRTRPIPTSAQTCARSRWC
jgi:hypothetical protein